MNKNFAYLFVICCVSVLFSCTKEYSVEQGPVAPSSGSLWDSTGACLPSIVYGTFYNGIAPGSDTAYVEVQVNVTQTGSYNISSDVQDGFQFLDSGFFSNTGINTVRLKPIGIPTIPVSATFTIIFDSSACSFTVNVQDSTGTGLGGDTTGMTANLGDWQFGTDSGLSAKGTFYAAELLADTVLGGTDLQIAGFTQNSDSVLVLAVRFPGSTITPGTYYSQIVGSELVPNAVFAFSLVSTGEPIYDALGNPGDGSNIAITIASYNSSTRVVTGTFSGKAIDEFYSPATIGITNGSFTATVSP